MDATTQRRGELISTVRAVRTVRRTPPGQRPRPRWQPLAVAFTALAAGVMVYALDRGRDTAYLLPAALHFPVGTPIFGALGGSLPSFAHALAFSVATALLPGWRSPAGACLLWWGVDSAFEVAQLPALAKPIAAALPDWCAHWPVLDHVGVSLRHGRFDPLDLLAIAAGCAAAFALTRQRSINPVSGEES